MALAELRVSTRPAFLTAVTRVDSTGLADAAVATGAVAIPVKLPAPEEGTAEQPEPKSVVDVPDEGDIEAEADIEDEADAAGAAAAELLELLELLQAAAPSAMPAVATETATVR
jgi:hypothetical protein